MSEQLAFPLWGRFLCWLTRKHKRAKQYRMDFGGITNVIHLCSRCGAPKPQRKKAAACE